MTDSWVLKAIEKEAIARAIEQVNRWPQTFSFMGYDPSQLAAIVQGAQYRHAITPSMTSADIQKCFRT